MISVEARWDRADGIRCSALFECIAPADPVDGRYNIRSELREGLCGDAAAGLIRVAAKSMGEALERCCDALRHALGRPVRVSLGELDL